MQIGELARASGVSTSRIRFYERRALLPPAHRTGNGYRTYEGRDLKIVAFIDRAQKLGFSLKEIARFLITPPDQRSAEMLKPRLEAKLVEIDQHIREVDERRRDIIFLIDELRAQEAHTSP